MHKCNKCGKEFQYKSFLNKHTSKKKSCDDIDTINNNYDKKINDIDTEIDTKTNESLKILTTCLFCNKHFYNKTNTNRHILDFCKVKKELINTKNNIIEEKNKLIEEKNEQEKENIKNNEIKELKAMIEKLIERQPIQPIQNITNNNNNINQTNNVIMINNFGNENLSHITLQDYKKYFSTYFKGFLNFIEKVHFDDNMPENHNICITNMKSKDIKVYEGDKWIAKPKTNVIDKFLRKKLNTLIDKCEEFEETDQITDKVVDKFSEFQVNYMDNSAKKNTKDDVILMIYNNKDKVKTK
jgi:hypothetical protein